jgi:hypothetical protein
LFNFIKHFFTHNIFRYLPELFPRQPPIVYVSPAFPHEILDQSGRVIDDSLKMWNFQSTLKNVTTLLLNKLEGKSGSGSSISRQENPQIGINQIISNQEDEQLMSELTKDLNSRSIEELILINFNPDDYIYEFTQKQRNSNIQLLQEVTNLSDTSEKLKAEYEEIKAVIDEYRHQYEEKEKELKEVYSQKQLLDNKFTVEKLIEEMKKYNEENFGKPRQKLINDFLSKKIDFETFKESFKELSQKYHYYSIIKDKMNLYK